MHRRPGEKRNNWLLIKASDDDARTAKDADILEEMPDSVVSGPLDRGDRGGQGKEARLAFEQERWRQRESRRDRRQREPAKAARAKRAGRNGAKSTPERAARRNARRTPLRCPTSSRHRWRPRATRCRMAASWVHEIKFDGYRMQARLDRGKVKLLTRKGLDWAARFPNVAADVARLAADTALIDGEIVVENSARAFPISRCCRRRSATASATASSTTSSICCISTARTCRSRPLVERKAALKELLDADGDTGSIRYSEHFTEDGARQSGSRPAACTSKASCRNAPNAPYRPGRSDSFIKIKCANAQELVVGGYVPSTRRAQGDRRAGAGYYRDGKLIYAGRVGTGYTRADGQRPVEAAASAGNRQAAIRRDSARPKRAAATCDGSSRRR